MLIYGIFLLCVKRMTMSLFVCLLVRLSISNCSSVLLLGSTLCKDLRLYLSKCFTPGSMDSQLQQVIRENLYLRAVPCEYPKKDCSEVALLEIKIPISHLTGSLLQMFFQKHRMFVQSYRVFNDVLKQLAQKHLYIIHGTFSFCWIFIYVF